MVGDRAPSWLKGIVDGKVYESLSGHDGINRRSDRCELYDEQT